VGAVKALYGLVLGAIGVVFGITMLACAGGGSGDPKPPVSQFSGNLALTRWENGGSDIYTMPAEEDGPQVNVTNLPTGRNSQPCWSPDGAKIAFVSRRDGNSEIYSLNADGGNLVRLTNDAGADTEPAWSPDGTRIAFVSTRGGNASIYTMTTSGTGITQVTSNPATDSSPTWSPNNLQIAFTSTLGTDTFTHLYTINVAGTGQARVGTYADNEVEPNWSPTNKLVYVRSSETAGALLYSLGPTGTGLTLLDGGGTGFQGWHPSWAPSDSQHIAFVSDHDGTPSVYAMDSNGNNVVRLTNNAVTTGEVAWGRD
jgi:Tol biopolymer transport system component